MPFQKMSRNEVLGDTPTHFFKSGGILRADDQEPLIALRDMLPTDRKIEYDIWYNAGDENRVHGYCYTDMLNQFLYCRPCCTVRAYQTMTEAAKTEITEEGEYLFQKMSESSDKYRLRVSNESHPFVIFMAGTNIWNKISDKKRLHNAVSQGAKLKCHPLTAPGMRAFLKTEFGAENIINGRCSGYELLEQASIVGAFTNSEMGLAALAKGKKVYLFNDLRDQYTYSALYNAVSPGEKMKEDRMKRVLSSKESGLIPLHAENPQEYIDGFFNRYGDIDGSVSGS